MPSFLQSQQWAEFKQIQGWRSYRISGFFALERALPLGIKLLYFPELGLTPSKSKLSGLKSRRKVGIPSVASGLKKLINETKQFSKKEGVSFARIEFFEELDERDEKSIAQSNRVLTKLGLRKSSEEMQPEHRQVIDLTLSEQELLAQMKPKGRYNIKVAQRHSVVVQKFQISNLKSQKQLTVFYQLYRETAARDGFTPRSFEYFSQMSAQMTRDMSCYIAICQGKPLATALVIFYQGRASYLYGGSSSNHRELMAPHLLHWQIIKDAKAARMKYYDLGAVAPSNQPHHKFAGLGRFKQSLGGRAVRVLGSYDLIFDPLRYRLFGLVEKLRGRF